MKPFSPNAQKVIALSRDESTRLKHNHVGTEHLLLGIIQLGEGGAVKALKKLGVDLVAMRQEIEKQEVTSKEATPASAEATTYTPGAKKVFALAGEEATTLKSPQAGTEHLLLGLLREEEGPAALVLKKFQVTADAIRQELPQRARPSTSPRRETGEPIVVPSVGKREALIAIVFGLIILAFVGYGVMHMASPVQGNKLVGVIIEKSFTPQKEQQISFNGRKIEGAKETDGEYVFKVHVDSQNRTYEVPVEKPLYQSKKVGDSMTFLRPQSEQN
jgi:hypothetical protein